MPPQRHQTLSGGDERAGRAVQPFDHVPALGAGDGDLHLHGFQDDELLSGFDPLAGSTAIFQTLAVTGEATARQPSGSGPPAAGGDSVSGGSGRRGPARPAFALGVEGGLLAALEGGGFRRDGAQKGVVLANVELIFFDVERVAAVREGVADLQQLVGGDGVEADLVEEAEQPGRIEPDAIGIPHLEGAADELVAAGALHAVDAEVGAADADRILRRPGARGVVLGGDEAVPRVGRRGDRRAEVDVAEAEHEIAGVEHDAACTSSIGVEAVDAADELDVAGAPGRVGAHGLDVLADGELGGRVVPGERQVDDAGWGRRCRRGRGWRARSASSASSRCFAASSRGVVVDLQRADAGRDIDDARQLRRGGAGLRGRGRGSAGRGRARWGRTRPAGCGRPAARQTGDRRRDAPDAERSRGLLAGRAVSAGDATEADAVAGAELADLPELGVDDGAGQTKPPRLGPSGPRMIGMSPVKSTAPMA